MAVPEPKRPLMTIEDRKRLRRMAVRAGQNGDVGHNRAYCQGVADVLLWLDNESLTPMLKEVTR